jgi:hypothetical protein
MVYSKGEFRWGAVGLSRERFHMGAKSLGTGDHVVLFVMKRVTPDRREFDVGEAKL